MWKSKSLFLRKMHLKKSQHFIKFPHVHLTKATFIIQFTVFINIYKHEFIKLFPFNIFVLNLIILIFIDFSKK